MKLTEITIENYRCFERLNISFHPEVTVLIAPNGAGKTTIIDAARIAMWPLVKAFDLGSQTGKSATIQIEDVRLTRRDQNNMEAVIPSIVDAQGIWPGESEEKHWIQTREKLKSGTNTLQDEHMWLNFYFIGNDGAIVGGMMLITDSELTKNHKKEK